MTACFTREKNEFKVVLINLHEYFFFNFPVSPIRTSHFSTSVKKVISFVNLFVIWSFSWCAPWLSKFGSTNIPTSISSTTSIHWISGSDLNSCKTVAWSVLHGRCYVTLTSTQTLCWTICRNISPCRSFIWPCSCVQWKCRGITIQECPGGR